MKFREYDNLKAIILHAIDSKLLANKVESFGNEHDIIDLQYSTCMTHDDAYCYCSVFIIYKENK